MKRVILVFPVDLDADPVQCLEYCYKKDKWGNWNLHWSRHENYERFLIEMETLSNTNTKVIIYLKGIKTEIRFIIQELWAKYKLKFIQSPKTIFQVKCYFRGRLSWSFKLRNPRYNRSAPKGRGLSVFTRSL